MSERCSRRPTTLTWPPSCPATDRTPSRVWAGIEDGKVAFLTSPDSRKARNVPPPRVAISVTDRGNPYVMALVRGRVTARLDGSPAWEIIDRLSLKYTGAALPAAHRPGGVPGRGRACPCPGYG